MRISDWSSDVCSSDLFRRKLVIQARGQAVERRAFAHQLAEADLAAKALLQLQCNLGQNQAVEAEFDEIGAAVGVGKIESRDVLEEVLELCDQAWFAIHGGNRLCLNIGNGKRLHGLRCGEGGDG